MSDDTEVLTDDKEARELNTRSNPTLHSDDWISSEKLTLKMQPTIVVAASLPSTSCSSSSNFYFNKNPLFFSSSTSQNIQINIPTSIKTRARTRRRRRAINKSAIFSSHNLNQSLDKTCDFQPEITNRIPNPFLLELIFSILGSNNSSGRSKTQTSETPEIEEEEEEIKKTQRGISSNMWWTSLKAALGQRLNFEGISSAIQVMTKDRHLALPHLTVQDIRWIDWEEMKKRGFKGVVFDKDNTLTAPYSLSLWPPLSSTLDRCRSVFGDNVVVFSNSAGLRQFDADGSKARAVEESIGIHVMRHRVKKPAGNAEEFENYFGCGTSELIMVGDRHFTDIVYGNRNGFLTILTRPLSLVEEPFIVRQIRKLEAYLVNHWYRRGLKPRSHSLLSEAMQCVRACPPL